MPYLIHKRSRRAGIAAAALLALAPAAIAKPAVDHAAKPAPAQSPSTPVPTATCTPPTVTQPFAAFGDLNYYTLAPGQAPDAFSGEGWTLTGKAKIISTRLQDGTQGEVLDLPSGSRAVSPPMCLTNLDPTARTMVRNVAGSAGLDIKVTYLTRHGHSVSTGNIKGRRGAWALSRTVHIHPSPTIGWQLARFTLVPHGSRRSDYRVYDFYVDPRMVR